jgi:hypothetical protein
MMSEIEQHFVIFHSPGTFVAEQTMEPVEHWDVNAAVERAKGIRERRGATPYGFCFVTRGRGPNDLDSKETARSNFYYLGVALREAADEIEAMQATKQ